MRASSKSTIVKLGKCLALCAFSRRATLGSSYPGLRAFDPIEGATSHPRAVHLFDSAVHWVGEPVVLVLAETTQQARAAAASPAQHVERRYGAVDPSVG
jgi:hypothetical protein